MTRFQSINNLKNKVHWRSSKDYAKVISKVVSKPRLVTEEFLTTAQYDRIHLHNTTHCMVQLDMTRHQSDKTSLPEITQNTQCNPAFLYIHELDLVNLNCTVLYCPLLTTLYWTLISHNVQERAGIIKADTLGHSLTSVTQCRLLHSFSSYHFISLRILNSRQQFFQGSKTPHSSV